MPKPAATFFMALVLTTAALALVFAQQPPLAQDEEKGRLKRSQIEEILKQDHAKSIEDAAQLMKLSEDLKIELEKSDRHVLSVAALRKAEEIEKIAKRIRGRMRRF